MELQHIASVLGVSTIFFHTHRSFDRVLLVLVLRKI